MIRRPRPLQTDGESLAELFARLIADGKRLARAEVAYYKQLALDRVGGLATAAALLLFALLLVQASLTTLLVGIGLALGRLIGALGTPGGLIVAAVLGLVVSGLCAWIAATRIARAAGGKGSEG